MLTRAAFSLIVIAALANAQLESGFHAPWVSCFDTNGRFTGAKTVRTPAVVSRTGKLRAYGEIDATTAGKSQDCGNTVKLFVSKNNQPYRAVFTEGPSDLGGTANSLGPVAWSGDGRWLAVEFGYWFYGSDNFSLGLLLYDSERGVVTTPDVVERIERTMPKRCTLQLRAVEGFDAHDRVVLKLADLYDEEGNSGHCIKGTAEWLYDPGSRVVSRR